MFVSQSNYACPNVRTNNRNSTQHHSLDNYSKQNRGPWEVRLVIHGHKTSQVTHLRGSAFCSQTLARGHLRSTVWWDRVSANHSRSPTTRRTRLSDQAIPGKHCPQQRPTEGKKGSINHRSVVFIATPKYSRSSSLQNKTVRFEKSFFSDCVFLCSSPQTPTPAPAPF